MKNILRTLLAALLIASCGGRDAKQSDDNPNVGTSTKIAGDSTLYGLACEGCTDSVLVFLPGTGGDPVVYNIIDATERHHVIGRPATGDWVAVVLNAADKQKADLVVNLDELKGQWVQLVSPTLRHNVDDELLSDDERAERDSILQERLKPIEMGFALKRHYVAQAIGTMRAMRQSDDDPVVFPMPKRYVEWHIFNGRLVLKQRPTKEDSLRKRLNVCDTADLLLLTRDSLRLRFSDGEQGYHRKTD